jgi:hypothetical protein
MVLIFPTLARIIGAVVLVLIALAAAAYVNGQ